MNVNQFRPARTVCALDRDIKSSTRVLLYRWGEEGTTTTMGNALNSVHELASFSGPWLFSQRCSLCYYMQS